MFSYSNTFVSNELSGMDFYAASVFADADLFSVDMEFGNS
jgi:hypothetical protein